VFRAYDPADLDTLVAVKLFRLDLPPERAHLLAGEFDRLIAANLAYPSIAAPLATGITVTSAYLVEQFVAGESLDVIMRGRGAARAEEALHVADAIAAALDLAAAADVTHGALHPRDILVSAEEARLTGLGIAKALERAGAVAPVRRPYAPPERAAGVGWDRRCDVFSLAAIVHEMLWARRVTGNGEQAARALTELPGLDLAALRRVFGRALAADPADRFETAGAFADALRQARSDEYVSTGRPLPVRRDRRVHVTVAPEPERRHIEVEPLLPLDARGGEHVDDTPADDLADATAVIHRVATDEHEAPTGEMTDETSIDATDPRRGEAVVSPEQPLTQALLLEPSDMPRPAPSRQNRAAGRASLSAPHLPTPPTAAAIPMADARSLGLVPFALSAVVFLAIGFAAGYGVASRQWPSDPEVTLSAQAAPPAAASEPFAAPAGAVAETSPAMPAASRSVLAPLTEPAPVLDALPREAPVPSRGVSPPEPAPARAAVPAPPVQGRLVVRSTPGGARVFVDGRDRGTTPLTLTALSSGSHTIRIARDGYVSDERRVVFSAARPVQTVTVSLAAVPRPQPAAPPASANDVGSIQVESRPVGAQVFVDGRAVGVTPIEVRDIKAGAHAVRLELSGYSQWATTIDVGGGERHRVAASLEQRR
jgi:hypothetical protein